MNPWMAGFTLLLHGCLVIEPPTGTGTDGNMTDSTDSTGTTTDTGTGCGAGAVPLAGPIRSDLTLDPSCTYLLEGAVVVGVEEPVPEEERVTLVVPAGTVILGDAASGGSLVVQRGGRIEVQGTEDAPVEMTSSQPEGMRAAGDWGGLVIHGRAPVACDPTGLEPDEPCEAVGEGGTGLYGGGDAGDSSGSLSYLRISFAGRLFAPDAELSGLALRGVGAGTTVDHVQVHRSGGGGVELRGGTVGIQRLLVTHAGKVGIAIDDGWTGPAQWVVVQASPEESDDGITVAGPGSAPVSPVTDPVLANLTVIGGSGSGVGLSMRQGARLQLWSSQIVSWGTAGLAFGDSATTDALTAGDTTMQHVLIDSVTPVASGSPSCGLACVTAWFEDQAGNELGVSDLDARANETNPTAPVFRSARVGGSVPSDPFFEPTAAIGAVPATHDWTAGWARYPRD